MGSTRVAVGGRRARRAGLCSLSAFVAAVALFATLPHTTAAQANYTEDGGMLPDGTEYLMRVPANWNGVLIRDLDFASGATNPESWRSYSQLLERGYAVAGTARHRLRAISWDPVREIARLDRVQDMVEARFGRPDRVIQMGSSGGGFLGLVIAEDFHDRIDGVIANAAHIPVWQMNTYLDGWFVLKALIAPDLPIVNLPFTASGRVHEDIPEAWRRAVDAAQETPAGRARIALAFAIGQWPAWTNRLTPQPDLEDAAALQHSMYHALIQLTPNPGGNSRVRKELAADGQQLSWNTGVDYREFFANANEHLERAVRRLYGEAGVDLEADLARINAFPRVEASPYALDWWNQPGRTAKGDPKIPLLRMHEIGDYQVPPSLAEGYADLIRANGREDLFRLAFIESPSHSRLTIGESMAAIETMMRRLDSGRWDSTEPEQLNELATSLHPSGGRFIRMARFAQRTYNRGWAPE